MRLSPASFPRRTRVAAAAAVAVLAAAALIAANATLARGGSSTAAAPAAAAGGVKGSADVNKLLQGIPQAGGWLGSPTAPRQMVVFADLQCPFCRQFDTTVMPTIVRNYVRTGRLRVFFSGMDFIGKDSTRGLRAAAAAANQNKLWNFVDLAYANQGAENSGWLSDKEIDSIARSIPGLDVKRFDHDRKTTSAIANRLTAWQQLAQSAGVNSTPTFFAGKPGALAALKVTALEVGQFKTAIDKLLASK